MTDATRTLFLIVTPSYNAPEFLDQTIESVVSQQGALDIRYHVQDGGSESATLDILRGWDARLNDRTGQSASGPRIRFSWRSEADRSMYDAIQKGFDHLLDELGESAPDRTLMTWINSDDRFMPYAFHTVAEYLNAQPEDHWVTGMPCLIREDGCIADIRLEDCGYARARLARGQYDGRTLPFVMQEGTFWTAGLWRRVGGLDTSLRLAGDWDLWRRMAVHSRLVNLRAVLAYHRRRPGQLSSDMTKYWAEVDALAAKTPALTLSGERIALDGAWMAAWRPDLGRWSVSPMRYRRDGLLHCISDCLVEALKHNALGRLIIKTYRRLRGVSTPLD